jgi:DNA gyrase subunit A
MSLEDLAPADFSGAPFEDTMKSSFLSYAMSVVVARALPDVRDGLKPVHRRIIYAMQETGNTHNQAYRKSARGVGDTMGKYHPHGDSAIYDAMVRMAQDFSVRELLIDGQGNFGSMDGDKAAAMRYTEARLSRYASDMVPDLGKDTVNWRPNYDGKEMEPVVLPLRVPNLLINGGTGIAVGMATNLPTHNAREAILACLHLLDNPEAALDDVLEIMPGPDFPTGGTIMGKLGIRQAYETGRGSFMVSSVYDVEDLGQGRSRIVITELPYQTNKAAFIERVAELVKAKDKAKDKDKEVYIEGISDIRDESDRDENVRVVIDLKRDVDPQLIINKLRRHTQFQSSFAVNATVLDAEGRPRVMPLLEQIAAFNKHRVEVVRRRTIHDLNKARDAIHLQLGLYAAVTRIDNVVEVIRRSADVDAARDALMKMDFPTEGAFARLLTDADPDLDEVPEIFHLSRQQADAILKLSLRNLTGLEQDRIETKAMELSTEIEGYVRILNNRDVLFGIVRSELQEMAEKHSSPRRTKIEASELDMLADEDFIERQDVVITVTNGGYIKRTNLTEYREQKRGGKGKSGMSTKNDDFVTTAVSCSTHSPLIIFTTKGMAYATKAWQLPDGAANARGRSLVNYLSLQQGEGVSSILALPEDKSALETLSMVFVTDFGNIRRTSAMDFARINRRGKISMDLAGEDGEAIGEVVNVLLCADDDEVLMATRNGNGVRVRVGDLRVIGSRKSIGVRGVSLGEGDRIISASLLRDSGASPEERMAFVNGGTYSTGEDGTEKTMTLSPERMEEMRQTEQFLLTVSERGFAKRTSTYEYRTISRGGKGITCMTLNETTGKLIACFPVEEDDGLLLVTPTGRTIRTRVADTRVQKRMTRGVRMFRLDDDETISSVARIAAGELDEDPSDPDDVSQDQE